MPMFTGKLGVSCATCHTSPPRLNETGYRFRAAGFRWPESIGEKSEEPFDPLNYNSVRVRLRYNIGRAEIDSVASTTRETNLAERR